MSMGHEAYYGSGLRLNEKEFDLFVEQYMEANQISKQEFVNRLRSGVTYSEDEAEIEFDDMVEFGEAWFAWSADLGGENHGKRMFDVTRISPAGCDGMLFQPYRMADGSENVYSEDKRKRFIGFARLRYEISYIFFSEKELDGPQAFRERPYGSYEEFEQEFKDKLGAYLPEDFDWNAHIGRFRYSKIG